MLRMKQEIMYTSSKIIESQTNVEYYKMHLWVGGCPSTMLTLEEAPLDQFSLSLGGLDVTWVLELTCL